MIASRLPGVAMPIVGAPGTVAGVTAFDGADAGPVPEAFVAVTVKVYTVPFARPATTMLVHGAAHVPVSPLGDEVAVKVVMADPPLDAGAVNPMLACAFPRVAVPMIG